MTPARAPSPTPRTLSIFITHHGRAQGVSRGITEKEIKEAIVHGREVTFAQKGQKGGDISKFYKTIVDRTATVPITKSIVAVCEVFTDRYVLVTVYRDPQKP